MSARQTVGEIANEAMKAAPPVSVTGLSLAGVGLSDWVLLATLIYTVLQSIALVSRWLRKTNEPRN